MERYSGTPYAMERWLRRRNEVIDGLGVLSVATFSAGILEAGTPNVESTPRPIHPETHRHMAAASMQLLRVDNPALARVYTDEAIHGRAV